MRYVTFLRKVKDLIGTEEVYICFAAKRVHRRHLLNPMCFFHFRRLKREIDDLLLIEHALRIKYDAPFCDSACVLHYVLFERYGTYQNIKGRHLLLDDMIGKVS